MKRDIEICVHCDEVIGPGERAENNVPMHYECLLRNVLGGANHFLKRCTCYGGSEEPDPPGLTKRQAAQVAADLWFRRTGGES